MTHPFTAPTKVRAALEQVLSYIIPEEANDYENTPPEDRDGHIYEALVTVRTWLHTGITQNIPGKLIEHAPLDTLAIADLVEAHGYLAPIWSVEDVQSVRPDLTDEQCREVLQECSQKHDAEIGINWSVIAAHADDLFPLQPS